MGLPSQIGLAVSHESTALTLHSTYGWLFGIPVPHAVRSNVDIGLASAACLYDDPMDRA